MLPLRLLDDVCQDWLHLKPLHHTQDLAEAHEAGDAEQFTDAIAEYDSMTRLDAWKTTLLLRSKKLIGAHDEHHEPDLT